MAHLDETLEGVTIVDMINGIKLGKKYEVASAWDQAAAHGAERRVIRFSITAPTFDGSVCVQVERDAYIEPKVLGDWPYTCNPATGYTWAPCILEIARYAELIKSGAAWPARKI